MPLSFPTSGILHLLWGGQSCPQPAFSRLFGPSCAPKESAESRLRPRLAAPRLLQTAVPRKTKWHWGYQPAPQWLGCRCKSGDLAAQECGDQLKILRAGNRSGAVDEIV